MYPNSTGDYWEYKIQSFEGEQLGFLEVRVIEESVMPNGDSVAMWIYSYPEFTDTVYKLSVGNTIEEYMKYSLEDSYRRMRYVFPIQTGMKWAISTSPYTDSVNVVSETTMTVPAGSFDHSLQLDFIPTHNIGNYFNHSHYWFTLNVGITRMEYAVYSLGFDHYYGIYDLVEFRLK
jgi:hypothetical protein